MKEVQAKREVLIWTSSLLLRNYLKRIFTEKGARVVVVKEDPSGKTFNPHLLVIDDIVAEKIVQSPEYAFLRKKPALIISGGEPSAEVIKAFPRVEVVKRTVSEEEIVYRAEVLLGISPRRRIKMLVKGEREEGEIFLMWVVDISLTGCRIRTDENLSPGDTIKIFFTSASSGQKTIEGRVVRKMDTRDEKGRHVREYGIKFFSLTPELEKFLSMLSL